MSYKYILFDLDGTLTESGPGIANSVAYALNKYGIKVDDVKELYKFVGPPLTDSFEKFYGFSKEKAVEATGFFREYFKDKGIFENSPYEGVLDMLKTLKNAGKILIIATSKPEPFAIRIAEHFGFMENLTLICGSTFDGAVVKKADSIRNVMAKIPEINGDNAVMVGDRLHDVEGAHQCGLKCAGVLHGYGSEEELREAGADFIFLSSKELTEFLEK